MKKIAVSILLLAGLALAFSCAKEEASKDKETIVPGQEMVVQGETVSISARLSDVATKVNFDPSYDAAGKTTSIALTWADTDKLLVVDHANPGSAAEFTLTSGAGEKKAVFSGTLPAGAASYDVSIVHGDVTVSSQTQPADGDASGLQYFASKTGLTDLSSIEFDSVNSVLAITAKLPADVAGGIKSVDIPASENIFGTGNSLTITLDEAGDAGTDDILHLFATLPEGDKAVPAGTTLLVHFNAPDTEHTVYTRFIELGAQTFTAGKCNTININATASASHAGLPTCDGSNADKAYLIGDKYQLLAVDGLMVAGATKYFKLLVDLDMTGEEWTMLNTPSPYDKLIDFDGNNKTISHLGGTMFYVFKGSVKNLTLDSPVITSGGQKGAFAQYIQGTGHTLTNVDVKNVDTFEGSAGGCGGLIGRINNGSDGIISATFVDCDITDVVVNSAGDNGAGGVLGLVEAKVVLNNCTRIGGSVSSSGDYAGGLIGRATAEVTDCSVLKSGEVGSVSGGKRYVGGLVGSYSSGTISNCHTDVDVTGSTGLTGGFIGDMNNGAVIGSSANGTVNNTTSGYFVGGLIGNMTDGTISNCHAGGAVTQKSHYAGGLVGFVVNGEIRESYSTGDVSASGFNRVGGLVGEMTDGAIIDSYATGNLSGKQFIAGLVGYMTNGEISGSHATGNSTATSHYAGGLVGQMDAGSISTSYASGVVNASAGYRVGGIVGWLESGSLTKCHMTGNLTAKGYVGGLVGTVNGAVTISKCYYSTGTITSASASSGGLVGDHETGGTLEISDSYFSGTVNGNQRVGGILGNHYAGTSNLHRCYVSGTVITTFGAGGIVGWVETAGLTVYQCMPFVTAVTATTNDGNDHYSSGLVIGYAKGNSAPLVVDKCYRSAAIASRFTEYAKYVNDNTVTNHAFITTAAPIPQRKSTADGTTPIPYGYFHHGRQTNSATLSALVQRDDIGGAWSSDVWDFSGELPTLK